MGAKKSDQTAERNAEKNVVTLDRRTNDRRSEKAAAVDSGEFKTPRRKKQRRRHIDPTTCERDYSEQEIQFMRAMDDYKHHSGRMFPTCSEVLEVIRALGYFQLNDEQIEVLGLSVTEEPTGAEVDEEECDEELVDA